MLSKKACVPPIEGNVTPVIECVICQELGEPFRRDSMKKHIKVTGIDPKNIKPQTGA